MLVIFDIDGTLACIKKRLELAGDAPDRNDRKAFQAWLDRLQDPEILKQDKKIEHVCAIAWALTQSGHSLVYLTGRSRQYREVTRDWLNTHCPIAPLFMRPENDRRPAALYKEEQIKKILADYGVEPGKVLTIDDDYDGDCSAMYLRLGIVHLKVYSP
jgi:FMN phosphatase YigB (HAD superfamily)